MFEYKKPNKEALLESLNSKLIKIELPKKANVAQRSEEGKKLPPSITIRLPGLPENDWYRAGNKKQFNDKLLKTIEESMNKILDDTNMGNQGDRRDLLVNGLMRRFRQVLSVE